MVNPKRAIKSLAQSVASQVAPVGWRLRRSARLLVLMYHRVLPAGHPDLEFEEPGMFVSPQTLQLHLGILKREFELVHLDDWLADADGGRKLPRRACAITFDDGWRDNYQYAYPLLREAGAPATIYLVTDLIGTRYSFWPNRLSRLLRGGHEKTLVPLLRERLSIDGRDSSDVLIAKCKASCSDAQMNQLLDIAERSLDSATSTARDLVTWEEIREMAGSGLVRFGSHTRRHTRLRADVSTDDLNDEIAGSQRLLADNLGAPPRTFCYPNGDHSPQAVAAVRERYLGAVTTQRGWNSPASDRCLLQRVGVHEDVSRSATQFVSRLAGVG